MAIAAAGTAANLYYCQPLLSQIARSLHMTARETAEFTSLHHSVHRASHFLENRSKSARVRAICDCAWTGERSGVTLARRLILALRG